MEISIVDSNKNRWKMEARQVNGRTLPPWTRSDETDHEGYDVTIMKRRKHSRRNSRDGNELSSTDPNVKLASTFSSRRRRAYDLPGNSLRETSVETSTQTTQAAVGSSQPTQSKSSTATTTPSATQTSSSPTSSKSSYDGASSSGSGSDSESASERSDDGITPEGVTTSAPASSETIGNAQGAMIQDGIHTDVHKILLGVGTVVGLILIASVLIIAWKLRKRSIRRKATPLDDMSFHKPSRVDKVLSKAPWFRNHFTNRNEWYTIEEPSKTQFEKSRYTATSSPNSFTSGRGTSQFFAPDKSLGIYFEPRLEALESTSTIDNSPLVPPSKPKSVYNNSPRSMMSRAKSTAETVSPVSPASTMFYEDTAVQVQVVSRQAPRQVRLSAQGRPVPTTPKWTYNHLKRQTGTSDLSSISSGFGDGDIIITPENTVATISSTRNPSSPLPVANPSQDPSLRSYRGDSTRGISSRQSSMRSYRTGSHRAFTSRQSSLRSYQSDPRRDTVSTNASLDSRPRFHSIGTWVKQQSGQVKRAQNAVDSDAPPVPMLPPPEQELRYMMPDGQVPRRVEM